MGASHSLKTAHGTVFKVLLRFISLLITKASFKKNTRLENYVRCYIPPLEISLTGCMSVKRSNTLILYIFETPEQYVFIIDPNLIYYINLIFFVVWVYVAREMDSANL